MSAFLVLSTEATALLKVFRELKSFPVSSVSDESSLARKVGLLDIRRMGQVCVATAPTLSRLLLEFAHGKSRPRNQRRLLRLQMLTCHRLS